ncbi:DUF2190 family protein [Tsukamurella sputi]|uniref:DUF2190 family protein n=1 Tax=Tsukamurella sputi TaxID=2591848 RepID=A0A5C5RS24_9ACTN|nr:capsid cement protein [Tsukamurella sputi]TWS25358.1 DUF2190 family protein [Tsukamurella sputi]
MGIYNNECIPLYDDGDNITFKASVAVSGKRFVDIANTGQDATSGTFVAALPTAGGKTVGVAAYDAPAGNLFNAIRGRGVVVPVVAGAAVTAGAEVQVDATGAVIPLASGVAVGRAYTAATASGAECFVSLY